MDFVVGDIVRQGFGFANPNHAAAAICAAFPFCGGWGGKWRWAGWLVGVVLCVMLAMTYSRTGFVVLAIEAALWLMQSRFPFTTQRRRDAECAEDALELLRCARTNGSHTQTLKYPKTQTLLLGSLSAFAALLLSLWRMWPRLALDGAVMNRPKIWLAGLRLFAANPMGVGFGNSGEVASAFMLPDGITVRTLVNSHLTLLAEMGAFVGGAWLAFIALALCVGRAMRRTWVAFAGLTVSAFSASVFDWHVLFDFNEMGGYGVMNFVLAWVLFAAFVVMGAGCVWRSLFLTQRRRDAEYAEGFGRIVVGRGVLPIGCVVVGLCAVVVCFRSDDTPRVEGEYVVGGGGRRWNAVPTVPSVYRDEGWSLKSVAKRFPDGARFCIRPGVPKDVVDSGEVWLFGDVAEAAWRFPAARLTLVSPPEFFDPPTNAVVLHVSTRSTRLVINAESRNRRASGARDL